MKNFRKSYLSMVMAAIFLFVSCEQYEVTKIKANKFDYSVFNKVKASDIYGNIISIVKKDEFKDKSSLTIERNRKILNIINAEISADLTLPDEALQLVDYNEDEIFNIGLKNNWITNEDVSLTKTFMNDMKFKGFDVAIANYESNILNLSLTKRAFAKKNIVVNTMKSINYLHPNLFKTNLLNKSSMTEGSWWKCALALVALVATTAGLTSCATIFACGLAFALHIGAIHSVRDNCFS